MRSDSCVSTHGLKMVAMRPLWLWLFESVPAFVFSFSLHLLTLLACALQLDCVQNIKNSDLNVWLKTFHIWFRRSDSLWAKSYFCVCRPGTLCILVWLDEKRQLEMPSVTAAFAQTLFFSFPSQTRAPPLTPVTIPTADPSLSPSLKSRPSPSFYASTRSAWKPTYPSMPMPKCCSTHIPTSTPQSPISTVW